MTNEPLRITIAIPALAMGGAERTATLLANHLTENGKRVHLICLDEGRIPPFFPLDSRVTIQHLSIMADSQSFFDALVNNISRLRDIRKAIRKSQPSVLVSFLDKMSIRVVFATTGLRVPVLARECTYPADRSIGRCWEFLRWIAYRRAASVVTFTRSGLKCFSAPIQARGNVIPNAVTIPVVQRGCSLKRIPPDEKRTIIGLGRLEHVKGFDLLVAAFARVSPRFPNWSLEIWGDGTEHQNLTSQIKNLKMAGRIRLPGVTRTPVEKLAAADLFVLPSRVEGFGQALCEAMACGLPVISFACMSGPPEIIRDGVDGILVTPGDVGALAQALERLMGSDELRHKLALRATEVMDRFSLETVMAKWEKLITGVVGDRTAIDV